MVSGALSETLEAHQCYTSHPYTIYSRVCERAFQLVALDLAAIGAFSLLLFACEIPKPSRIEGLDSTMQG